MMSSKLVFFGAAAVAVLAIAVAASVYVISGITVSTPGHAASVDKGDADPAPKRFDLAQAQVGGQSSGAATASSLPGGASSLNETYEDWRVACVQQANVKRCVLSQVQARQNGQRVLAIELKAPSADTVSGSLILPFGLALDAGVTFQIDEKPAMQQLPFRTCLPAGCVVDVSFDAPTLVALRAGAALEVKATADGGAAAPFSISLQGFATAIDRVAALSR